MAIKTKEEIMENVRNRIGDSTEDADLEFLEDITDTLNDYDNRITASGDWQKKYEDNDKEWRQKYKDRFFNNSPEPDPQDPDPDDHRVPRTYEELFTYE